MGEWIRSTVRAVAVLAVLVAGPVFVSGNTFCTFSSGVYDGSPWTCATCSASNGACGLSCAQTNCTYRGKIYTGQKSCTAIDCVIA